MCQAQPLVDVNVMVFNGKLHCINRIFCVCISQLELCKTYFNRLKN
jgi:hypothetical protein